MQGLSAPGERGQFPPPRNREPCKSSGAKKTVVSQFEIKCEKFGVRIALFSIECVLLGLFIPWKPTRQRLVCGRYLGDIYRNTLRNLPMDVLFGGIQADSVLPSKRIVVGLKSEFFGAKFMPFGQRAEVCPIFIIDVVDWDLDKTGTH